MKLNLKKHQILTLPAGLFKLLNAEVRKLTTPTKRLDAITFNFMDSNYSASAGGYPPVEIRMEKVDDNQDSDCWKLIYITDFSYQGAHYPELVKEIDVCFISSRVYTLFGDWLNKRNGNELLKLFIDNFIEYHSMGIYTVKVSFD
ncbi:DUF2787 family protein [Colwellia sp. UCD-KL20]|uniref:DUF2787 family protein n=1 Tax=Colwellia sp. UCD-KL20 TaxID=1917165 RepID=UPI0009702EAA|nr:DUF2787 family protein [Colwellia sp. UCD-KL20]